MPKSCTVSARSELLVVALDTIIEAARSAGGKFVVVDAIDDPAAAFYAHHEFEPISDNPHRFTRKLSTIARAFGQPWTTYSSTTLPAAPSAHCTTQYVMLHPAPSLDQLLRFR